MTAPAPASAIREYLDVDRLGYSVMVIESTSFHSLLLNSEPPSPLSVLREKRFIGTVEDDEDAVVQYLIDNPGTAYFGNPLVVSDAAEISVPSVQDRLTSPISFGLQKDSELKDLFDFHLVKMREEGILGKLTLEWDQRSDAAEDDNGALAFFELEYRNVLFPFVIFCSGIAGSLLAALFEYVKKMCIVYIL